MIQIELERFRVKPNKTEKVNEWMAFLNEHMADTLLTLIDEKMYVESIHREFLNDEEFLYWYSIQGEGGTAVTASNHEVDKKHLEYWQECIDPTYQEHIMKNQVVMIPDAIRKAMK